MLYLTNLMIKAIISLDLSKGDYYGKNDNKGF